MSGFKKKFAGSFDLLFLFGRGINAFSGTRKDALQSLVWPALIFPFSLVSSYFYPPKGMESGYSYAQIAMTVTVEYILSIIVSAAIVFAISYALGKRDKFWLFFEATNWVALAFVCVIFPVSITATTGLLPRTEMDRVFAIISCYGYIVTACIAWRALLTNWQIAGAIAIVTLFVDQELWHTLYGLQGIPVPW